MDKKRLLFPCDSENKFEQIVNFLDFNNYEEVVVVSDDFKIYELSAQYEQISFTFLKKTLSYTKVAKDVAHIVDTINRYFKNPEICKIFDKDLTVWTHNIEGGDTTQTIQDMLLYIENIENIIRSFRIDYVVFFSKPTLMVEQILYEISKNDKNIEIEMLKRKVFNLNKKQYKQVFKNLAKIFYFPIVKFYIKLKYSKIAIENFYDEKIILFQLCNNAQKHIDNILFTFDEFTNRGYTPLIITWNGLNSNDYLEKLGHKVLPLEMLLSWNDFAVSLFKPIQIVMKKNILRKIFYEKYEIRYKNITLNNLIFPNLVKYLLTEAPDNYRLRKACDKIVFQEHIRAVKYCSAYFAKDGSILADSLGDQYVKFNYNVGVLIPNRYTTYDYKKHKSFFDNNFITFLPNNIEKQYLLSEIETDESLIKIMGSGKAGIHFKKAVDLTKKESFEKLGLQDNYELYILVDYPVELFGFCSLEEIYQTLKVLFDFIKTRTKIALLVKPHPSAKLYMLHTLVKKYALKNIIVMDKKTSIPELLRISDLFICKFSTLGIEAMIYDVQVVSCLFDKEPIFKMFGDSAHYVYSYNELKELLEKIFVSKDSFDFWKDSYKEKRKLFIEQYYPELNESSVIIAKNVEAAIKRFYANE